MLFHNLWNRFTCCFYTYRSNFSWLLALCYLVSIVTPWGILAIVYACDSLRSFQLDWSFVLGCIICRYLLPLCIHSQFYLLLASVFHTLNDCTLQSPTVTSWFSWVFWALAQEPSQLRLVSASLDIHWCLMLHNMCLITLSKQLFPSKSQIYLHILSLSKVITLMQLHFPFSNET